MTALWHPLSGLLLPAPRVFVSTAYLRRLLRGGGRETLLYAGDAMWPTVGHGQPIQVGPLAGGFAPPPGSLVVAEVDGVPDLLRVIGRAGGEVVVQADAVPASPRVLPVAACLDEASIPAAGRGAPGRVPGEPLRRLRRWRLDLAEALRVAGPDRGGDPAASVRRKYEEQAAAYRQSRAVEMEHDLMARVQAAVPAGGRVLVAGCGAGRECFALAQAGFRTSGVDFAAAMIAAARAEAKARGLEITWHQEDLLRHREEPGSLDAILFTFDVYSFLPGRFARSGLLRRMAGWLGPDGVIFLSARCLGGVRQHLLAAVEGVAGQWRGGPGEWGDSHTRWLGPDGEVRRAFIHRFTRRGVAAEVRGAELVAGEWRGGHVLLRRRRARRR